MTQDAALLVQDEGRRLIAVDACYDCGTEPARERSYGQDVEGRLAGCGLFVGGSAATGKCEQHCCDQRRQPPSELHSLVPPPEQPNQLCETRQWRPLAWRRRAGEPDLPPHHVLLV